MLLPLLRAVNIGEKTGASKELCHAYSIISIVYCAFAFFGQAVEYTSTLQTVTHKA